MRPSRPAARHWLHRCAKASAAAFTILLIAGCHHKQAHVSRQQAPPPYTSRRGGSSTSSVRRPVVPRIPGDDNLPSSGTVAASETGMASWYGPPYANHRGANGQIYDSNAMTAAHRTLPMGTVVRVTNLTTNQSATVKITDRGPFVHGRVIDLSIAAAKSTGLYRMGVASVRVEVLEQGASAATSGRWCVQVGAFLDSGNAERLKSEMVRRYSTTAKVVAFPGPTGHWVRINPLSADRARASAIAGSIRPAEPDAQAYLVRLD